ncbi:MAG: ATP-binding protein [Sulfolobales archaeon]|nr:ATP-binding protein [Sulfolobales archaeon]MCX8209273.1 ATP-binding protein [Sulfolobales archaeon]MDW8010931.1 ATP-binding protein [Sulfolobales archaeon]
MYSLEVVSVVFVVFLNLLIGYFLDVYGFAFFFHLAVLPLMSSLCGFLVSRSRSLLAVFAEFLYLAVSIYVKSRVELAIPLLIPYVLSAGSGLARRREFVELGLREPANYRAVVVSVGFSLVGIGVLELLGVPLSTPLGLLLEGDTSPRVVLSTVATYLAQAYLASTAANSDVVALALASSIPPYTLPALTLLQKPVDAYVEKRYLKLGRVVEVIRGPRIGELLVPFEKGASRNVVIVGATGTGKSTLAKQLINQVEQLRIPTVVFDPHGEYCRDCANCECVKASELSINIPQIRGEDVESRAEFIAEAISEIYSLGSLQRIALAKTLVQVLRERSSASFSDILDYLLRISRGELEVGVSPLVARSLVPYVENLRNTFRESGRGVLDYLNLVTVVDYSELSRSVATVVAELVLDELYHTFRDAGREMVLVVDEAQIFLKKSRALARLFREGRKYGISSILVTQNLSSVPREVLLNSAVLVFFSNPEISEARYIAKLLSPDNYALYEKVLGKLTSLPRFHALVSVVSSGSYVVRTWDPYSEKWKF